LELLLASLYLAEIALSCGNFSPSGASSTKFAKFLEKFAKRFVAQVYYFKNPLNKGSVQKRIFWD
jgi:hypothetical protein